MTKTILTLIAGVLTLSLSGCSLFKSGNANTANDKSEPMLPHDREVISNKTVRETYTSEELKKGIVKGDWSILEVDGQKAVGERAPFLKFVPGEKRVYGNNGCNTLNGDYAYNPADSTLRFGQMLSTMMACNKEGITDYQINQALEATRRYDWKIQDSDYYLYFYNADGKQVMTLMHQNFDFLNGTWLVTSIDDNKLDVPDMKLVIDVDEGKLHGNTGCNILNGTMEIDMEEANSISFNAIGMTRMACPDMNYETALIVALEEASTARPVSRDEVLLFDSQGKQVLSLRRTTDK
ncbi:MAG: META domain-containing protein [Bacteroidales bacterium]|nr:META domain-containing protein [Bacteroidales bacterium]